MISSVVCSTVTESFICQSLVMGSSESSCPKCPEQCKESSSQTTVSLFAFSWNTWHAQSISLGLVLGVILITSLLCICGQRFLDCWLPRSCWPNQQNQQSSGRDRCREISIPMQAPNPAPMYPNQSPYGTQPPHNNYPGFDLEAVKRLCLEHK